MRTMRVAVAVCTVVAVLTTPRELSADMDSELEGTVGHATPQSVATQPEQSGDSMTADDLEGSTPVDEPSAAREGGAESKVGAATEEPLVSCEQGGPCIEVDTKLPLRVLPRSLSHLYRDRTASPAHIKQANVRAFHPLYVFARKEVDLSDPANLKGWYQVGVSRKGAQGWMRAADVIEWRQALLVSYTHPGEGEEGRNPVLMFRDLRPLQELVTSSDREQRAKALYKGIESKQFDDALVSMEPKRFVDITQQFYILPIIRFDTVTIEGDEARYLQLAAAVPGARGADTLDNKEYVAQADKGRGSAQDTTVEDLRVNVVLVMDTTRSTQPYIDSTRDAVEAMVKKMEDPKLAGRVRFGLIAYRDAVNKVPKLEYTARNFTPEMVDGNALLKLLDTDVKATSVGSIDYAEEVFAGIDLALRAPWEPDALRFVVLVGDASSHPKGHPQNTTGKDAKDLRREADDAQIHIFAIHLQDERAAEDHEAAEEQFATLSRIRGSTESALYQVDAFEQADFQKAVESVTDTLLSRLSRAVTATGDTELLSTAANDTDDSSDEEDDAGQLLNQLWDAALIEYIGKSANPPKDVTAWALDRDLVYPADRSLDVRVMITRTQLSSLVQAVDAVVQASMQAQVTQMGFFDALQSISGQALKRPEDIGGSTKLADSGLLPAFIQSLPYKSDVLSLTGEMYASMSPDERAALERNLIGKLRQYRAINEKVDGWTRLAEGDPDSEMVYPLHLDYMP